MGEVFRPPGNYVHSYTKLVAVVGFLTSSWVVCNIADIHKIQGVTVSGFYIKYFS